MKRKLLLCISLGAIFTLTACNLNLDPVGNVSSSSSSSSSSETNSNTSSSQTTVVLSSISTKNEKKEYQVNDTFVKPTVTAHYNDGNTKNVTSKATFTGFDSSKPATNQKITVSYTEAGTTKTTSYTITVSASSDADTIVSNNQIQAILYGDYIYDLPIYYTKNTVDVPYVKIDGFFNNLYIHTVGGYYISKQSQSNHVYKYGNQNGSFDLDCSNDTILVRNPGNMMNTLSYSNGVPIIADGIEKSYVKVKNSSSLLEPQKNMTYNLSKYGIDIIEYQNDAYIPLMTVSDLLMTSNGHTMGFNGKDLYCTPYFSYFPDLKTSFYSESPWLNKSTRTSTLANYTYNELCFYCENIYGLHITRNFTNIDSQISSKGYKDGLLSTNSYNYETTMQRFTGDIFYDGHSGYTAPSPYQKNLNTDIYDGVVANNPREKQLMDNVKLNRNNRSKAGKGIGTYFYNNTAIVAFDSFVKDSSTSGVDVDKKTYSQLAEQDSYLFFKKAFKDIKNHGGIEKVVFDVTCNGGGMVDALPWLEAFMTDDPIITFKNVVTGEISDAHYSVDLNQDGTFNSSDTYKGQYDFYVLTSNFSFSCANAFPTFAKSGKMATIIGQQSGGGACAVGEYVTASGTILRSSSPWQFGSYANSTWTDNDGGVPVDYELEPSDFYNSQAIYNLVNTH